jgi:lantibiotic modifying enzyme
LEALSLSSAELTTLAARIGTRVLSEAIEAKDGSLTWGRGFDTEKRPIADGGLFNGRVGEALLFAALGHATGEKRFLDASRKIVRPLQERLRGPDGPDAIAREIGLGLAGLGSVLYAFVRLGKCLHVPSLIADACKAADGISCETIQSDSSFEFVFGTSGLILGLLAVADTGHEYALAQAKRCAAHLLANRVADSMTGLHAWPTSEGKPSSGFAHGSSGIAHSLLQLYGRVRDAHYYEAAIETFEFERTLFVEETGDWLDVRDQTTPVFCTWCHGAPGVGLSRLSAIGHLRDGDQSAVLTDLRAALHRTLAHQANGDSDNLCCGNLGRADFLLEAGRRLENRSLISSAYALVCERVRAATPELFFRLPLYDEPHLQPGLWHGVTGIAYTLLRFGAPDTYGSLLLLS